MSTPDITTEIPYGYCHCGCGRKTPIAKNHNKERGVIKGEPLTYINRHNLKLRHFDSHAERFWSKVAITANPDKCWEWQSGRMPSGYGKFWFQGTHVPASRFAYRLSYGEIAEGLLVCHSCDNRTCCNPAHLFLGTHQDNMQDMVNKNRQPHLNKGQPSITIDQFQQVLRSITSGMVTKTKLATDLGISPKTIEKIISGKPCMVRR